MFVFLLFGQFCLNVLLLRVTENQKTTYWRVTFFTVCIYIYMYVYIYIDIIYAYIYTHPFHSDLSVFPFSSFTGDPCGFTGKNQRFVKINMARFKNHHETHWIKVQLFFCFRKMFFHIKTFHQMGIVQIRDYPTKTRKWQTSGI